MAIILNCLMRGDVSYCLFPELPDTQESFFGWLVGFVLFFKIYLKPFMSELFLYFLIIGILKEVIVQILVKPDLEDSSVRAAIIFPHVVSISAVCP